MTAEVQNVFSLDFKVSSDLLSLTVFGSEFQVAGPEQQKAQLVKTLLLKCSLK